MEGGSSKSHVEDIPVTVRQFFESGRESLTLEIESGEDYLDRQIKERAINRPGLALTGFFQYFAHRRIQVFGLAESTYLKSLESEEWALRLTNLFQRNIPCVVYTRNRHASRLVLELADKMHVPVLRSPLITSQFINGATLLMEDLSSPRTRVHGTMVDIMGVGVLIEGEAGIGKSETALALIERGHSLVADDITVLHRNSSNEIVGTPVELTRYHMEIRGLGLIHVPSLFGVASMRHEKRLDLIVCLVDIQDDVEHDRTGLSPESRDVLGISLPLISLPVAAGRDMAHVVEVAALNQKLKILGHDAAKELDDKIVRNLIRKKVKVK